MAEFDDQLNAILSNPDVMSQIMSIAGSMSQSSTAPSPPAPAPPQSNSLGLNPAALQGMMELMQNSQIDPKQRNLIHALQGYLPSDRIEKLEKAMQASKIARFAASSLGNQFRTGR